MNCPAGCHSVSLVLIAALFLSFATSSVSPVQAGSTPFADDDFEDGSATDAAPFAWLEGGAPGGTRTVVAGDYVVASSNLASSYVSESRGMTAPVTIATQLRITSNATNRGFGGIFAISPSLAAYWGGVDSAGQLYLGESTPDGHSPTPLTAPTSIRPSAQDILLELTATGNQVDLTAWVAGQSKPKVPQLTYIDPTPIANGSFGVLMDGQGSPTSVSYRWFSAVPEPTGALMIAMGGFIPVWCRRRRG